MERRTLGKTNIKVSPVAFGAWPIAGVTSLGVNDTDSIATIQACFENGINFIDTAYCYGYEGESETLIRRALGNRRDEMVIASKGGLRLTRPNKTIVSDGSPDTIRKQCEESLQRLGTDRVELYYLHAPDPNVPVEESAIAFKQLLDEGKILAAGVSNVSLEQLQAFHKVCPVTAVQPPYNMLQRGIEKELVPWCRANEISVCVYWPLMKGLLAGTMTRDFKFDENDGRKNYPMFQGEEWEKNMTFVDSLREIAAESGHTVAQLVVHWTIRQPGITVALCGAKRPWQIDETAGAMGWKLKPEQSAAIDKALEIRGLAATRRAV